jgi:Tfp pilus assembly protein PilO
MKKVSVKTVAVVAAVASMLLVAVWYFAIWHDQSKQLHSAHAAHAAAEQQVRSLTTQAAVLEALLGHIPQDQAKLLMLESELPDTPSFDQALRDLHAAAVSSGAKLTSVSPTPAVGVGLTSSSGTSSTGSSSPASGNPVASTVPSVGLSMSASGTSSQVETFLSMLENLPRSLIIDRLSLSGTSGNVTASLTARIFYTGGSGS